MSLFSQIFFTIDHISKGERTLEFLIGFDASP